jgi:S-formylglutathione hydrolase FrmB
MTKRAPVKRNLTRRALLIGGGAVVLAGGAAAAVDTGVLPGRNTMFRLLGLDGPAGSIPNINPGPMVTGSFVSKARLGKQVEWAVSYPPGSTPGDPLPVLIALHGFGGSHASTFGRRLGLDRFLAQSITRGTAPFAIASIDGGDTYWHHRSTGEDAGAMVVDEFVPLLASRGLSTTKVGLFGWSMGGFGALHLASGLGMTRVATVVAESPALWPSAARSAPGAFDNPADWAANNPLGRQAQLDGIAVRIDCGEGDGFYPTARAYVDGFSHRPAGGFSPGGHNLSYWRRMAEAQLAFVGAQLSR